MCLETSLVRISHPRQSNLSTVRLAFCSAGCFAIVTHGCAVGGIRALRS